MAEIPETDRGNFVNTGEVLLEVNNLKKYFPIETGFMHKKVGEVKAVDDVSIYINRNETLGLVGESGCGKTTLGRCIMRAVESSAGEILFHLDPQKPPVDILKLGKKELLEIRRNMAIIFQNPYSSLDPRMTVLDIVGEPLYLNGYDRDEIPDRVKELVSMVGLETRFLNRYPHAFSGGQR
ncbi:MAG: ATP-binding cassette domain-containing protein [Treponema sp.]|jgi:peptide/nickel transport system ATP-binding protein|nr:ATP-binding cassette domain-containing protein [Treponema sp.]